MARATRKKEPKEEKPKNDKTMVKRPARGYHKFRNGLLNVRPKGSEIEITKRNMSSPLLKLPGEIRTVIWKLVLGGQVLRAVPSKSGRSQRFKRSSVESSGVELLCVCRSIYVEAATFPMSLSTFAIGGTDFDGIAVFKRMKLHQRELITSVQFEFWNPWCFNEASERPIWDNTLQLLMICPGTSQVRFRIYTGLTVDMTTPSDEALKLKLHELVTSCSVDCTRSFQVEEVGKDSQTCRDVAWADGFEQFF